MTKKPVICEYCGNEKIATGRFKFKCCGVTQEVASHIKKPQNHISKSSESPNGENNKIVKEAVKTSLDNAEEVKSPEKAESSENLKPAEGETPSVDTSNVEVTSAEEIKPKIKTEMVKEKPKAETLEIEEHKEEEINPDDWDFRCPDCNELFNEKGNRTDEGIICPDCKAVLTD